MWWNWCKSHQIPYLTNSISEVLKFLSDQFSKGASYSVLNTIRSALSLLISPEVGSDFRVRRFLKGVYRLRPSLPKYNTTWNPSVVLDHLAQSFPNEETTLQSLTLKLATLLALITAHRVQTLAAIEVENIEIADHEISIKIPARIKTSGPRRVQPTLLIPFFEERPSICPARTLKCYLDRTRPLRGATNKLFISFKKPHAPVSSQTLSRWIKSELQNSGLDTRIFTAHSTRHASTSAASRKGISLDLIRKTAGWTSTSDTFNRVYNRPVCSTDSLARAVLSL